VIWGIGPALQASTHTDDALGNDKWAAVHIGAQGAGFLHATRVLPEPRQAGGARSLVEATVDGTPLGEEEIASIRRELGEEG